jgi:CRP/FNR family transcriptional regulator, cyclic AMP receptor protein
MEKDIALLREITLFKGLQVEKIQKILNIMRKVVYSENETIMREGDSGDTMYIILEGTVEVVKIGRAHV